MRAQSLAALLRLVRAGVFTAACLVLAVTAHIVGGGQAPGPGTVAVAAMGLWAFFGMLTARERGGRFLGVAVVSTQALLHLLFANIGRPPAGASGQGVAALLLCSHGSAAIDAGQLAAAQRTLGVPLGPVDAGAAVGWVPSSPAAMLAAHLVAALGMAWWLRRGERAAWSAIRQVARRVTALLPNRPAPVLLVALAYVARPRDAAGRAARALLFSYVQGMRAPPVSRSPLILFPLRRTGAVLG